MKSSNKIEGEKNKKHVFGTSLNFLKRFIPFLQHFCTVFILFYMQFANVPLDEPQCVANCCGFSVYSVVVKLKNAYVYMYIFVSIKDLLYEMKNFYFRNGSFGQRLIRRA